MVRRLLGRGDGLHVGNGRSVLCFRGVHQFDADEQVGPHMSQLCIELLKGLFTLAAVALGSFIALKVYFRQKEYELAKQRYLEGGVDIIATQVEQALGVVSHNWARCLNLCKSFRDSGSAFEVKELERGFLSLDSSQFRQIAHHRVGSLLGSKAIWYVYQHAMAYATDAHSRITMEIPEVLRVRTTTDLISADHEQIAAKLLANLQEIQHGGFRFATLISELHTLGRLLESEPISQKAIAAFHKRPEVQAIVARLRREFPDAFTNDDGAALSSGRA